MPGDERAAGQLAVAGLHAWEHDVADAQLHAVRAGGAEAARAAAAVSKGDLLFEAFRQSHSRFVDLIERRLAHQRDDLHRDSLLAIGALVVASAVAALTAIMLRRWARAAVARDDQRARERTAFSEVHRLGAVLAAATAIDEIGDISAREAAKLLGAGDVHVWTIGERERLYLCGSTDALAEMGRAPSILALSDGNPAADAVRENRLLVLEDRTAFANVYPGWLPSFDVQATHGVAVLPARCDGAPVGALEVFYRDAQVIDDAQRTLLERTADQIGSAIGRALARAREHAATARLQESLLGPPMLVDGVGHSARYLASESTLHVGGDWHNAQRLADGRILIAVGDAVGRGLEAATVMGQLRSAVSACALRCATPAQLLDCLDEFAAEIPGASSATIAIAFVDVERESLEYVCAGHPPPLLVSPEGAVRVLDGAVTWPLAVGCTARTATGTSVAFPAGSLVLLYSDGLIAERATSLDARIARLADTVRTHWNSPIDALTDHIITDVLGGRRRHDDVAVLALRSPVAAPGLFLMTIEAAPAAVGRVRERLRSWLDSFSLDPDDQLAILVAAGEACTNAIEHAYGDGDAHLFRVEAAVEDGNVVCCITDTGTWKDNVARTARGNGLNIIRELMDEIHVDRRPTGTSVTLTFRPRARRETSVLG